MFRKQHIVFGLLSAFLLVFSSCSDDDPVILTPKIGTQGFYVVNEGAFGNGNTSISFYDRANNKVSNDLFISKNGVPLGDQAQSMTIHEGKGYIVVQNSAKIEVVDANSLASVATISVGLPSPRYFIGVSSSKAYVSDWGTDGKSGTVKVIDLTNNTVSATINTGRQGPNRMVLVGAEVFVSNSGGRGRDSVITVINTTTDAVTRTITVADNPNSLQVDSEGNIWVACGGHTSFDPNTFVVIEEESTPAAIIKISPGGEIRTRFDYTEVGFSASADHLNINADGNKLYYRYSSRIYELSTTATALPTNPFSDKSYYALSVDPTDGSVIGCETPNFTSSGNIDIYATSGSLISTFSVGIGPNGCTFL